MRDTKELPKETENQDVRVNVQVYKLNDQCLAFQMRFGVYVTKQ